MQQRGSRERHNIAPLRHMRAAASKGSQRGRCRLLGDEKSHLAGVLGVGYTDYNMALFDLAHEAGIGTYVGRLTAIVGAEVHGTLSDHAHLNLSFVDRVHGSGFELVGVDGSNKTQNDLVATAGLAFGL